jgi:beta-lactam-binding protein with PASTA domain
VREEPQAPSVFDPEITPEMDAIVLKALTKDPDYRYQSADEMRVDIEACLDGQPVAATAAMGSVGYGGYPDDRPTTALRSTDAQATSMLPPMNPDDGGFGYDDRAGRRRQQKKSNTSTILLVVAGLLVLVGAILIGKWAFTGDGGSGDDPFPAPNFVNQTQSEAEKLATNRELKLKIDSKPCEDTPKNSVCAQSPKAETQVKTGDTITLTVSTGAPKVAVPGVVGDPLEDAQKELEGDDYQFEVETKSKESDEEPGTVLNQDPKLGTEVEKGSTITLTVAKEKEQATVPDVSGLSCDDAKARMEQNDLKGNCTDVETDDDNLVGKVVATSPTANSSADPGSTVNIQIGKAAEDEKFAMPKVTQMTLAQAKQVLAQNQLQLGNVQGSQDDNAIVLASNPQEGQQVKAGDRVNLGTIDAGQQNNGGNGNGGLISGANGAAFREED